MNLTRRHFVAMLRHSFGAPLTEEQEKLAKEGFDGMSDWQSMSMLDLDKCIQDEEAARTASDAAPQTAQEKK